MFLRHNAVMIQVTVVPSGAELRNGQCGTKIETPKTKDVLGVIRTLDFVVAD